MSGSLPRTGRLLSVDWGEKRIGLAVSDETQLIATPLGTLTRRAGKRFPMPAFLEHVMAEKPIGILVGLPLESSGDEGPAAAEASPPIENLLLFTSRSAPLAFMISITKSVSEPPI